MIIMFLTVTILALSAVVQADVQGNLRAIEKRGAIGASSPSGLTQAQQEAYIAKIRQYQQAQAQAQLQAQNQNEAQSGNEVRYVSQPTKYTGSPVTYTSGAAEAAQYQQQQQNLVYSQAGARQSPDSDYSKAVYQSQASPNVVPHFSLASDVSTFSYSSPVVRYSNLGLLSQLTGKQTDEQTVNYNSAPPQAQAPAQRTVYYQQSQTQQPAKTRVQYVPQYEAYTQQEQKSQEPAQRYFVASQKYASPQGVPQQRYVYVSAQAGQADASSAAPQQYVYQAVPQSRHQQQVYQSQPQYESKAQASPSVPQSIYVRIPQQYQPQQFSQQKHGVVYAN